MNTGNQARLGHIDFINCLPLAHGLKAGGFGQDLDIVAGAPSWLNRLAIDGKVDITPVSSIIYAINKNRFLILPDVSISAKGILQSIILVAKRPIYELEGAKVALTYKSATSHILLKIIMNKAYNLTPDYFISQAAGVDEALQDADAALFIGDDALYAYHRKRRSYYYYDLGGEWKKLTGQAMVYALWVVDRRFAGSFPELVTMIHRRVTQGFSYGLSHLPEAAAAINGKVPFTAEQILHYLDLLNYGLSSEHQTALLTYYSMAQELGYIADVPALRFARVGGERE
ncbi:MAG TPA: menaquinone biosynthesis protein [Methylomusa anaerophila]|uniref:Chorismate dehydratase n=1 Tax=Methylomusa anaerophila TaxID=1930071 RepID=A0A348AML3_9FIRM|nr:menaquinone biosynthesis protein [Methylomusa anaerophila]BBB92311.1 chorismate dehydratase [Methylomusa anaerophila]HML90228.1 menaquinone biosynthesis protein [Methylomusa anaerophila]